MKTEIFEECKKIFDDFCLRDPSAAASREITALFGLPPEAAWLFTAVELLKRNEVQAQFKIKELQESFPPFDPPKLPDITGNDMPITMPREKP